MIAAVTLGQRLKACQSCPHWNGVCSRGGSPLTSCPLGYWKTVVAKPTVKALVRTVADDWSAWRKAGFELVDEATHARRFGKCRQCVWYSAPACTKCWCVIRVKSKLAGMKCPIGLW